MGESRKGERGESLVSAHSIGRSQEAHWLNTRLQDVAAGCPVQTFPPTHPLHRRSTQAAWSVDGHRERGGRDDSCGGGLCSVWNADSQPCDRCSQHHCHRLYCRLAAQAFLHRFWAVNPVLLTPLWCRPSSSTRRAIELHMCSSQLAAQRPFYGESECPRGQLPVWPLVQSSLDVSIWDFLLLLMITVKRTNREGNSP